MASENLITLTDANFRQTLGAEPTPLVVDFWAEWCGPCRAVAPAFAELAKELKGRVRFGKLNIDESNATAAEFGIRSIPTFLVFKGGKVAGTVVGVHPKDTLRQMIEKAIA